MKTVTAKWAKDNAENINLIDVRTPAEYQMWSIQPSKNIPVTGLIMNHETFLEKDKDTTWFVPQEEDLEQRH